MKHLITGGAGFIGTNYVRYILEKYPEDEIVCVDKLTYAGNYDNLKQFEDEIEADDREFEAMKREHEAKMAHRIAKLDELNYIKEQLDNGVAIEDLDGIAYFDGDFGSFGLSL